MFYIYAANLPCTGLQAQEVVQIPQTLSRESQGGDTSSRFILQL